MSEYKLKDYQNVYHSSSKNEGPINRYVYRILSLAFVWIGLRLRLTPNQLTYLSFVISIISAMFFIQGDYGLALLGLIPFHLGKIIDCADGQLAKLTNSGSTYGAFLDPFLDRLVDIISLASLSSWYFSQTNSYLALWMLMVLISIWFIDAYLAQYDQNPAVVTLKKAKSLLPVYVRRLIAWDGGFGGLIFTIAVVLVQIPALIFLYLIVAAPTTVIHFYYICKKKKNDDIKK